MVKYPILSFEISQEKDEKVCIQRPEGLPLKISGKVNIIKYVDSVYKIRLKDIQASRDLLQNEWDKVNRLGKRQAFRAAI
ncbi:MAG: hypothetical protein ACP5MV_03955 [Candidatus Parvarchaeum sp.]